MDDASSTGIVALPAQSSDLIKSIKSKVGISQNTEIAMSALLTQVDFSPNSITQTDELFPQGRNSKFFFFCPCEQIK